MNTKTSIYRVYQQPPPYRSDCSYLILPPTMMIGGSNQHVTEELIRTGDILPDIFEYVLGGLVACPLSSEVIVLLRDVEATLPYSVRCQLVLTPPRSTASTTIANYCGGQGWGIWRAWVELITEESTSGDFPKLVQIHGHVLSRIVGVHLPVYVSLTGEAVNPLDPNNLVGTIDEHYNVTI